MLIAIIKLIFGEQIQKWNNINEWKIIDEYVHGIQNHQFIIKINICVMNITLYKCFSNI